jgi:hypothetical protein
MIIQDRDKSYIQKSMDIIKTHDPDLYYKMLAHKWEIFTMMTGSDDWIIELMTVNPVTGAKVIEELFTCAGLTYPELSLTFINAPSIADDVNAKNLNQPFITAEVLAHEFRHICGEGEKAAYAENLRVAHELHDPAGYKYYQEIISNIKNTAEYNS